MPTPEELLTLLAIELPTIFIGWLVVWLVVVMVDGLRSALRSDDAAPPRPSCGSSTRREGHEGHVAAAPQFARDCLPGKWLAHGRRGASHGSARLQGSIG